MATKCKCNSQIFNKATISKVKTRYHTNIDIKAEKKTETSSTFNEAIKGQKIEHNINRRNLLSSSSLILTGSLISIPESKAANKLISNKWDYIDLPIQKEIVLLDVGFTGTNPKHGFIVGTRQTLLETFDGGYTWNSRSIQDAVDEGFNFRFNSISFNGDEGWIVGKPAIVLHTENGGKTWERVPLSAKLPGSPILITAIAGKPGQAEMTTDQGAIYVTNNAAYTWQAAVQETVDATLNRTVSSGITGASYYEGFFANIRRSPSTGDYVAVSSRGNFYMTWSPGDTYWTPHNRPVGRRVQNMGWTNRNSLWVTSRGGDLLISDNEGITESFQIAKLNSRGFGLLDVGFRDDKEGYACGGSGTLLSTNDGGKSWKRDKGADVIPGNLYFVKFTSQDEGFILGNNKILLK